MKVHDSSVTEEFFKNDRWFVRLEQSMNGRATMPRCHYVWLLNNPAFPFVPTGYVIHHLDGDSTNDDISNLALMGKYHHIAYHWKQKKPNGPVLLGAGQPSRIEAFMPEKEPTIKFMEKRNIWTLNFTEIHEGVRKRRQLSIVNGIRLKTYEDAEKAKNAIWGR